MNSNRHHLSPLNEEVPFARSHKSYIKSHERKSGRGLLKKGLNTTASCSMRRALSTFTQRKGEEPEGNKRKAGERRMTREREEEVR